jgi:Fe-S oxidoreductase
MIERILFTLLALVSLGASYITFRRMARAIGRGQGRLGFDDWPARVRRALDALVWQGDIIRHRRWTSLAHFVIAWGFLYYVLLNLVDLIELYAPGWQPLGAGALGGVYRLLADLLSVGALAAMFYFLVRRFVARAPALRTRADVRLHPAAASGIARDSLIVGTFIVGHVGSRFLSASLLAAAGGGDPWQPFASAVAGLWTGWTPAALGLGAELSRFLALGLILAFLPYFPYSKHVHLLMGPFNLATKPLARPRGMLDAIDFDDESVEAWGAARLSDLPSTRVVDAFACIMCNRCQEACPAYLTGKELSPAALEINKRYHLRATMADLARGAADEARLLDYALTESALWACTACGACVEVCPVGNEPMVDLLDLRRHQVLMESAFPSQLTRAFTGLERQGNPWGIAGDRLAWARSLPFVVPTVEDNPDYEVLYWVGCAGAFDPNGQRIARAIATLLHAAGVNFAVLGEQEACTGDMARRAGNEYLFVEMAKANIATLDAAGAMRKTIVAGCPHCLYTLGREYRDLGGHYTVLHHTQLIEQLLAEGRLPLTARPMVQATFHDPCYLGRQSDEIEAPRRVLGQAGLNLVEMAHSRRDALCCGAGGGQMWKEEEPGSQRVSALRLAEAQATSAALLATACPFCNRMLGDASAQAGGTVVVKDVAELLAEAIQAPSPRPLHPAPRDL